MIAVHNAAGTIAEAIGSVLAQTVAPTQLIVSDDGSTDGIEEAVAPYGDRLTYLRKARGGVASAWNAALEIAVGEFFAVLGADDVYEPERLEALRELAVARPDLDILCTDVFFERDGDVLGRFTSDCPFEVVDQKTAILGRCFCIAPAVRRETLVAAGGFDESLRTGSDWECAIRLIHSGAAAGLVDEPLYRYRVEGETLTSDRIGTLRDRIFFLEGAASSYELGDTESAALDRSLAAQRNALVLTEAEAALRSRARDARSRALAAARSPGVAFRARAFAIAAAIAPRAAARILERRTRKTGHSRLARSVPRG
ncbi:MAG: glycosyltransferase [Actinomycetota bacterium]|nr:glycosyltransferase [Actinomycetota bacterium]